MGKMDLLMHNKEFRDDSRTCSDQFDGMSMEDLSTGTKGSHLLSHFETPSRPTSHLGTPQGVGGFGGVPWGDVPCWGDEADDPTKSHLKNDQLLAMLNDIAKSVSDDAESDWEVALLPPQVQDDDPIVKKCQENCGEAEERLRWQAEQRQRVEEGLLHELQQIQDRSERQDAEKAQLVQRLQGARQLLERKLQEARGMQQSLRDRIRQERDRGLHLKVAGARHIKDMIALESELNRRVCTIGAKQAALAEELELAADAHSNLQSELHEERVATRRQSRDIVLALAQRTRLAQRSRGDFRRAESPRSIEGKWSLWPFGGGSSNSKQDLRAHSEKVSPDDVYLESWEQQSTWLRSRAADEEKEQARLQDRIGLHLERIGKLSKQLNAEERANAEVDVQLEHLQERLIATGMQFRDEVHVPEYEDEVLDDNVPRDACLDVLSCIREAEDLQKLGLEREALSCERARERMEAERSCDAAREELARLRAHVVGAQAECQNREESLAQGKSLLTKLDHEVQQAKEALSTEEEQTQESKELAHKEIEDAQSVLRREATLVRQLREEYEERRSGCCQRRRRHPSGQAKRPSRDASGAPNGQAPLGPGKGPGQRSALASR